ncbi:hypothetical protein ACJX0J_023115, partial [Zea mays]
LKKKSAVFFLTSLAGEVPVIGVAITSMIPREAKARPGFLTVPDGPGPKRAGLHRARAGPGGPFGHLYPWIITLGNYSKNQIYIRGRPPPVHYSKPSRTDRNRNYRGNYQDGPPQKLSNIPLAARWKRLCPHSRVMHKVVRMVEVLEGRNDYTDRSGYNGPPDFRSQSQYQGHVNPAGQGQ